MKTQEVTMNFYFRQYWNDPRLSFDHVVSNSTNGTLNSIDAIFLDEDTTKNMWTPDTFFTQDKESFHHKTTKRNTFTKVHANGDVIKSDRYSVTIDCPMSFQYFPFDRPHCLLDMESCKL